MMTTSEELTEFIRTGNVLELEQRLHYNPSLALQKTKQGISLLQFAVYCRNKNAIDLIRPLCSTDLFEAASRGELTTVRKETEHNPKGLNAFAADGFTALGLACFFDQYAVADFLLRKGANPNIASNNSFNVAPIHSACAISSEAVTELLLKHGANVNAKQTNDITPLHETAHNGKPGLTKLLLDHGAAVNAKTTNGQTPLAMAMERGFAETAELLTRFGAH
jgi:ankyrin repeat protein